MRVLLPPTDPDFPNSNSNRCENSVCSKRHSTQNSAPKDGAPPPEGGGEEGDAWVDGGQGIVEGREVVVVVVVGGNC